MVCVVFVPEGPWIPLKNAHTTCLYVVRDSKELAVEWTMAPGQMLVPALHGVDAICSYFIVGGLVFVPVSFPFLEQFYGSTRALLGLR